MVARLKEASKRLRKRSIEDAVSYAVAHGIRVDILCYLNETPRSPSTLAELMALPLSKVEHHIKELLASGSIELARVEKVRNTNEHYLPRSRNPVFYGQGNVDHAVRVATGNLRPDLAVEHGGGNGRLPGGKGE